MLRHLIGIPQPYPLGNVPEGFLAMNGSRFDKNRYPILAERYPSGYLPDLRGEFIRGWDNGRNVDAGRNLLSSQSDAIQDHFHLLPTQNGDSSKWEEDIQSVFLDNGGNRKIDGALIRVSALGSNNGNNPNIADNGIARTYRASAKYNTDQRTAGETRPRNIAFQYICLAG
ncbi:hypothetical protein BKL49_04635 [Rodentibacter myodis]|uniref:Phage tail collar domain-containing protein n=2 Tax=Rodentibacter myodis TaxID=1907939 RepID=A0A1V3JRI4_9PAST|nr:hypothetical protein BKL49_04635 [Rodentibacter myodis]